MDIKIGGYLSIYTQTRTDQKHHRGDRKISTQNSCAMLILAENSTLSQPEEEWTGWNPDRSDTIDVPRSILLLDSDVYN